MTAWSAGSGLGLKVFVPKTRDRSVGVPVRFIRLHARIHECRSHAGNGEDRQTMAPIQVETDGLGS